MARWTVPLLGIALLAFSLGTAPHLDGDMLTPAARAAIPDGDLLSRQRKAEVAEATRALSAMLVELESAHTQTAGIGATVAYSADRWRDRLDGLKGRYHIWGTVDRQHPDTHSENALHSALLLLYSMEHAFAHSAETNDWSDVVTLREKFQRHLEDANRP